MVPDNATLALTLRADTLPGGGIALFNASGDEVGPEMNTGADRIARVDYVVRDPVRASSACARRVAPIRPGRTR